MEKKMIFKKAILASIALATLSTYSLSVNARDNIEIVGSSTVFPFATVVAETFGNKTGMPTPKIEATGTGGGMKLFCKGHGLDTPDVTNASRRIKKSEFDLCQKNGVKNITEVLVGFDGIAIANELNGPDFNSLTLRSLYLGLAAKVPASVKGGSDLEMINNPFKNWSEIDSKLPNVAIKVLGPPPTSGTRDALQELGIEGGCKTFPQMKAMKKIDSKLYKTLCRTVREDGHYVEMGENDNLIISKLTNEPTTLGVFGFSFLDQNSDKVKGSNIDGNPITFENIATGAYPVSRPLYFYVKNDHRDSIKGLNQFINEFVSDDAMGEEGYLLDKGLIPAPEEEHAKTVNNARNAVPLQL